MPRELPELLRYVTHGHPMKPNVLGGHVDLATLAREVYMGDRLGMPPVVLDLEPGDATRYTLVLTRLATREAVRAGWHRDDIIIQVTRIVGGRPAGTALLCLEDEYQRHEAATTMWNGNEWTGMVLAWWLDCLAVAVQEVKDRHQGTYRHLVTEQARDHVGD